MMAQSKTRGTWLSTAIGQVMSDSRPVIPVNSLLGVLV